MTYLQVFEIVLDEYKDYALPVPAPDKEKARLCAETLYKAKGKEYFIQNGVKQLPKPVRSL